MMKPVKWTISKTLLHKVNKELFDTDAEIAGSFQFDDDESFDANEVIITDKGTKTSVHTPAEMVNFHTHPLKAYIVNKCVYGWNSGEDMRECIKFALKGNITHCVFSLEGVYTLHIRLPFVTFLRSLTPEQIGCIVHAVETYFRSFHYYRTYEYQQKHAFTPFKFVDLCNKLTIARLRKLLDALTDKPRKFYCVDIHGNMIKERKLSIDKLTDSIPWNTISQEEPLFLMIMYIADNMKQFKTCHQRYDRITSWTPENRTFDVTYNDDDMGVYFYDLKNHQRNMSYVKRLRTV